MELGRPARRTPHPDIPEGPPAPQTVSGSVEKGLAEFGTSSAPCSLTLGEHKVRVEAVTEPSPPFPRMTQGRSPSGRVPMAGMVLRRRPSRGGRNELPPAAAEFSEQFGTRAHGNSGGSLSRLRTSPNSETWDESMTEVAGRVKVS